MLQKAICILCLSNGDKDGRTRGAQSSEGLAEVGLADRVAVAGAWCAEMGADAVSDLEGFEDEFAAALELKLIPRTKLLQRLAKLLAPAAAPTAAAANSAAPPDSAEAPAAAAPAPAQADAGVAAGGIAGANGGSAMSSEAGSCAAARGEGGGGGSDTPSDVRTAAQKRTTERRRQWRHKRGLLRDMERANGGVPRTWRSGMHSGTASVS